MATGAITTNFDLADATKRNNIPLVGIYFKNNLPKEVRPGGYIFNLANEGEDGTHWVGGWVEKDKKDGKMDVVYFDPFGFPAPENIKKFFSVIDRNLVYSRKQIQNINSFICGYYVLYFLFYMSRHTDQLFIKMKDFMRLWSFEPENNRSLLERYLKPLL